MDNEIDLLQIKIDKAKAQLSDDTLNAINAVNWKTTILSMRETRGFSFEQLGDLEIETELVLCGLLDPKDYPKELESRMKISQIAANELVEEMNKLVFSRIKEELIKITEREKTSEEKPATIDTLRPKFVSPETEEEKKSNMQILSSHGIEILNGNDKKETLPVPEKLELTTKEKPAVPAENFNPIKKKEEVVHPILVQKLSGSFQTPTVKTEHSLDNITKTSPPPSPDTKTSKPYMDPYREIPE